MASEECLHGGLSSALGGPRSEGRRVIHVHALTRVSRGNLHREPSSVENSLESSGHTRVSVASGPPGRSQTDDAWPN
ncbi:hypothetical protein E2C01_010720 [Portunus trituberculatus]|uniref:Uncharacterized protein n=1 Tax=Portunus trituberculatus TaxID=210409 RepID=A0A5B7D971_PORTR|nr:hypothetical protein [Portunus trituberculatus]